MNVTTEARSRRTTTVVTGPGTPAPSTVTIPQYGIGRILAVWAAAALPMAALAWIVAPRVASALGGSNTLSRALLICLTAGLAWQLVLVVSLVWFEQRSLRWATVRDALWLRSPRSPRTGRVGGKTWLIVIPLLLATAVEELVPRIGHPVARDLGEFFGTHAGHTMMRGSWGWLALIAVMAILNTVLGEELLFRGFLLPRMNGTFGRFDWLANGVLFAGYHLHVPWAIPSVLLDTFIVAYPTKRYRSAWIGIAVHSAQSVFFVLLALGLVLGG